MKTFAFWAAFATAAFSATPATASERAIPETMSLVAEFAAGSGDNTLGVEQPPEDASIAPRSIAVLPGKGFVILDTVNQRLAINPINSSSLTTFAPIDPSVAAGDIAVRKGDVFVLDSARARILRATQAKAVGSEALFETRDIATRRAKGFGAYVGLTNDLGVKSKLLNSGQILLETGIDVSATNALADQAPVFGASRINLGEEAVQTERGYRLVRLGGAAAVGPLQPDALKALTIVVEPLDVEPASIAVVGAWIVRESDDGTEVDVRVQELDTDSPVIFVQSSIRRYKIDADGGAQLAAVARLAPVEVGQLAATSDNDFAYQLRPVLNDDGAVTKIQLLRSKFGRADCNATFAPLDCIPPNAWPNKLTEGLNKSLQEKARARNRDYCKSNPAAGDAVYVYRRMLDYGLKYVNLRWSMNSATERKQENCDGRPTGWSRAPQLNGKRAGDTVFGVPYGWGGSDSLDGSRSDFRKQLSAGKLAGNICTGNNMDTSSNTGLDCSAFVQRIYGLAEGDRYFTIGQLAASDKLSTSSLQGYVLELPKTSYIVPGDILLKIAGNSFSNNDSDDIKRHRHVLALIKRDNGEFGTIESTLTCLFGRRGPNSGDSGDYKGTCLNRRSNDSLNGYIATRSITNCQQPKP